MKTAHDDSRTQLLLDERGATHGNWIDQSELSQAIQLVFRTGANWGNLTCGQREALQMIAHKIARILSGDPKHIDHWRDCCGYAQCVVNELIYWSTKQ